MSTLSKLLYFQQNRSLPQLVHGGWAYLANGAFSAFLMLTLSTPSWRSGPFIWWPLWQFEIPNGQPTSLGILAFLPLVCVLAWMIAQFSAHPRLSWEWGNAAITLPLLALSLLILLGLEASLNERTIIQGIGLALFWFSYLYTLNSRPPLTFSLLLVVLIQGSVAVAQFALQRDLGLASLGEFTLDRQVTGTSVLWNSNQEAWLRGYGLTAHPNVLGGMMAVLLLLLLAEWYRHQGWQQMILTVGFAMGLLGLLVSFSRTGWLAFVSGAIFWVWSRAKSKPLEGERQKRWPARAVWVPLLTVPLFLFLYHDLVFSRWFHLGTLIEARSIQERLRDAQVALQLIAAHPWIGVGAGNALEAAQAMRADAMVVHNVPLLVMVELGLLGGICWLLFLLLPLLPFFSARWLPRLSTNGLPARPYISGAPLYGALWIGLLVAGFFDTPLWLTTSWRAALLLGLLAALQAQRSDGAGDGGKEEAP